MTNQLFNPGREGFLSGEIDADTAVVKAILVKGYTFDASDKFVSDLTGVSIAATSSALASVSVTDGIFDASDVAFGAVAADAADHSVILYQASAVGGGADVATSAQRLIAWIDTGSNFPIVPNGGTVTIQWDSGANKIFKL